jgi:O-antigen/teichoic acid export membrane protein
MISRSAKNPVLQDGVSRGGAPSAESVTSDGAILFAGRLLAFLIVFLTPVILARMFSVEEYGLYRQVFLIQSTMISILPLGLPAGLVYFMLREPVERSAYITQTVLLLGALALIGGAILTVFGPAIAVAMNSPDLGRLIPLVAVLVVMSTCPTCLENLMIATKASRLAAATHVASEVVRAGLAVGAAVLLRSVPAVLVAAILWSTARNVALLAFVRYLGVSRPTQPDGARLARQWRYSFPFGLAAILKAWADSLHFYLVAFTFSVGTFATYSVGFMQIPLADIAFTSFADVTLVRVTELKREERLAEARNVVASSMHKLSLALFPLYVWLLINARDLIRIVYTERFASSATIFMVSLSTIPLSVIALDYVPRGFGDTRFVFRVNLMRLVLTGPLVLLLAHVLGPIGAAIGTILALAATKGVIIRHVSRLMAVPMDSLLPWGRLAGVAAAAAAAGLVGIVVKEVLPISATWATLGSVVPFAVVYAGLSWTCGVLLPEEKASIRQVVFSLGRVVGQHA